MNLLKLSCSVLCRNKKILPISIVNYSSKPIIHHPVKFEDAEDRWKKVDDVPKDWTLIYKAPMSNVIQYLSTYITVTTSVAACSAVYFGFFSLQHMNMNEPILFGDIVIADSVPETLLYATAFCILHLSVKLLISKYVLRLYQNGDNYKAVYVGHLHNSIKTHKFNLDECKKLNPTIFVSWGDARYSLGKRQGILLESYFKSPAYFNRLVNKSKIDLDDD